MNRLTKTVFGLSVAGVGICGGMYLSNNMPQFKTSMRMNKKISFTQPKNYIQNKPLEHDIFNVVNDGWSLGVWVLCAPKGTGKTTAIKKILEELQDKGGIKELSGYDWNNNNAKITITRQFKPVYIDLSELSSEQNVFDLIGKQFGYKLGHFYESIPNDKKAIIVLDHMGRDVIDGFKTFPHTDDTKANAFFSYYAPSSYNSKKFVLIIVTDDPTYADDILTYCNGGAKVHLVGDPMKYMEFAKHDNAPSVDEWNEFKNKAEERNLARLR